MAQTKRAHSGAAEKLPETAGWKVKGDGVAYTTSRNIINSVAGRRHISEAAKVRLTRG